jgi:hypothetical protein
MSTTPSKLSPAVSLRIYDWESIIRSYHLVEKATVCDDQFVDIEFRNPIPNLRVSADDLNKSLSQAPGNALKVMVDLFTSHGIIKHYKETLLAFFDIQAYSAFINKETTDDAIWKVNRFMSGIRNVSRTDIGGTKFDFMVLSDSVILVVDTMRAPLFTGSVVTLLMTCSLILEEAMEIKLPLRGAVGGGDFFSDGEMLISTALVDAASYEKKQDWFGAIITPTAMKLIEGAEKNSRGESFDINSPGVKDYVRKGQIPWKKGFENSPPLNPAYFIKPYRMNEKEWDTKYIPDYFNCPEKIENSRCLYQED